VKQKKAGRDPLSEVAAGAGEKRFGVCFGLSNPVSLRARTFARPPAPRRRGGT
jgi:hypothetical protein